MTDVFISYAREDQDFVRRMAPAFEAEGFSVWWDHSIPPGKTWDEVIAKGITDARCCVVLWSRHSVTSDWVKEEATIAKDHKKFLPVQIDNSEPPVGFRRVQAAHLQDWNGDANHPQWQMLVREVRSVISNSRAGGKPSAPPRSHSYGTPPPERAQGSASPVALIAMVVSVAVAVIAVVVATTDPQQTAAVTPPTATAPGAAPAAPPPDYARAEADRLEREAQQAREAQRIAEQRLEEERRARQRAAAVVSAVGSWRGYITPWSDTQHTWTLHSDGRFDVNGIVAGHWSQSGSRVTWRYSDFPNAEYVGTISGNTLVGNATAANSPNATFRLSRQ